MNKWRGIFLLCVFAALGVFMVASGWRHFVLVPFGVTTDGIVTAVHQPPPWRIREADIDVTYGFVADRRLCHGKDTVAPARRPGLGGPVRVLLAPQPERQSRRVGSVADPAMGNGCCAVRPIRHDPTHPLEELTWTAPKYRAALLWRRGVVERRGFHRLIVQAGGDRGSWGNVVRLAGIVAAAGRSEPSR